MATHGRHPEPPGDEAGRQSDDIGHDQDSEPTMNAPEEGRPDGLDALTRARATTRRAAMARRPDPTDLIAAAERVLGHTSLRSGQLEALQATMSGRDVVAVMPTGHGKSALYQLPAALLDGVTVVVSPSSRSSATR